MMTSSNSPEQFDRHRLVDALEYLGAKIHGDSVICPFHDDTSPSGSLFRHDNGTWKFKCHACGWFGDILDVRKKMGIFDRFSPATEPVTTFDDIHKIIAQEYDIEKSHKYTNSFIVFRVRKNGKKRFVQVCADNNGNWTRGIPSPPYPLYNIDGLKDNPELPVLIVEGEKCVDYLRANFSGYVPVTSFGGCNRYEKSDWTVLKNRDVIIWPDNDAPGYTYAKKVSMVLSNIANSICVIHPNKYSEIPEKGDVADLHPAHISEILDSRESIGYSSLVNDLIGKTVTGERSAISWPWPSLGNLTKALLPGTLSLVCGSPGSSKSFFLLQCISYWNNSNIPACVYEMEDDKEYHLMRSVAQASNTAGLMDDTWVREHGHEAAKIGKDYAKYIDSLAKHIYDTRDKNITLEILGDWVDNRAKDGYRIICVDPVTAADSGSTPWLSDREFVMRVKAIAREYNASIILVTHPKKGGTRDSGLDALAGGAAYQRFSQSVIGIKALPELERHRMTDHKGITISDDINRIVRIFKARNGRGTGADIGCLFDPNSLTFKEMGVINDN